PCSGFRGRSTVTEEGTTEVSSPRLDRTSRAVERTRSASAAGVTRESLEGGLAVPTWDIAVPPVGTRAIRTGQAMLRARACPVRRRARWSPCRPNRLPVVHSLSPGGEVTLGHSYLVSCTPLE